MSKRALPESSKTKSWRLFDRFYEENKEVTHIAAHVNRLVGPIDQAAVRRWLKEMKPIKKELEHRGRDDDLMQLEAYRMYAKAFAKHVRYISVTEFVAAMSHTAEYLVARIRAKREELGLKTRVLLWISTPLNKSYTWTALMVWPLLRNDVDGIRTIGLNAEGVDPDLDADTPLINVLLDDAAYSGSQMHSLVRDLRQDILGWGLSSREEMEAMAERRPIFVALAFATNRATKRIPTAILGVELLVDQTLPTLGELEQQTAIVSMQQSMSWPLDKEWEKPAVYFAHKLPDAVSVDAPVLLHARGPYFRESGIGELMLQARDYSLIQGGARAEQALYKDYVYTLAGHVLDRTSEGLALAELLASAAGEEEVEEPPEKKARLQAAMRAPLLPCAHCRQWPAQYAMKEEGKKGHIFICSMTCGGEI